VTGVIEYATAVADGDSARKSVASGTGGNAEIEDPFARPGVAASFWVSCSGRRREYNTPGHPCPMRRVRPENRDIDASQQWIIAIQSMSLTEREESAAWNAWTDFIT